TLRSIGRQVATARPPAIRETFGRTHGGVRRPAPSTLCEDCRTGNRNGSPSGPADQRRRFYGGRVSLLVLLEHQVPVLGRELLAGAEDLPFLLLVEDRDARQRRRLEELVDRLPVGGGGVY